MYMPTVYQLLYAVSFIFLQSLTASVPVQEVSNRGTVIVVSTVPSDSHRVFQVSTFSESTNHMDNTLGLSTIHETGKGTSGSTNHKANPPGLSTIHETGKGTIIIIGLLPTVTSSPTSLSSPEYVPDPSGRGTVGLLTTCILTLTLCVWTAIHMNIDQSTSWWTRFLHKASWAFLATIAPEVVLWRAWSQFWVARQLYKEMNKKATEEGNSTTEYANSNTYSSTENGSIERPQTWSLQLGFFAVMGGFIVGVDSLHSMFSDMEGMTVTPKGIRFLAKNRTALPKVDIEAIQDKNKSDSLAKLLVCLQAGWMFLQTIARQFDNLPITLLELNTLAHVVAAVIMYGFWWLKPQNVNKAETVHLKAPSVVAIMSPSFLRLRENFSIEKHTWKAIQRAISSHPSVESRTRETQLTSTERTELIDAQPEWEDLIPKNKSDRIVTGEPWSKGRWTDDDIMFNALREKDQEPPPWRDDKYKANRIRHAINKDGVIMLLPGQQLNETIFTCIKGPIHLTEVDIQRLDFMSKSYHSLRNYITDPVAWKSMGPCLANGAPNMLMPGGLEGSMIYGFFLLAILSGIYGAVHALAWNGHFPSYPEEKLWRVSVTIIATGGFGVWLVVYLAEADTNPLFFAFYLIFCICPVIWAFARIFIVLEAFISVRSLPAGAYDTVAWTYFLPHIG